MEKTEAVADYHGIISSSSQSSAGEETLSEDSRSRSRNAPVDVDKSNGVRAVSEQVVKPQENPSIQQSTMIHSNNTEISAASDSDEIYSARMKGRDQKISAARKDLEEKRDTEAGLREMDAVTAVLRKKSIDVF